MRKESTVGVEGNDRDRSGQHLKIVSTGLDSSYIAGAGGSAVMSLGQWENSGTINRVGKSGGGAHQEEDCEFRLGPGPG